MAQAIPIMNVLRVPPRGQLVVELDGQQYTRLADIPDDKLRRRVMAAVGELVSFAAGYQALVDAGYAAPLHPPAAPQAPVEAAEDISAAQAAFLARLEKERDAARQQLEETQKEGRRSLLRGRLQGDRATKEPSADIPPAPPIRSPSIDAPPLTVAEQIDIILQQQVAADPELTGRTIRLEQAPQGLLRIIVDGSTFDRPGDVTDRRVQGAIKRALREWDRT